MIKYLRTGAVLLLTALVASAQNPAQGWNTVKALAPGTEVRVTLSSRTINGQLQSASDDSLTVNSGTGQEVFARQDVTQIAMKKRGRRVRNTFVGLGVGSAAGLGVGVIAGRASDCNQGFLCGLGTAIGAAAGLAIGLVGGAIIGAAWHTGGWREVYRH